ncbi:SLATT domain-containing protein [Clostridium gasigenes]|uniref:SLATT domain-containing protein n=1 Tax=Clostridium gasigenes TaxID=94869 RepID=UPI001C0AA652|nr:SLATT domain-containing protein [Clostridium gasigenes]MBU3103924.1 SLATT domain-containing protein [Clostridium gasigenes]
MELNSQHSQGYKLESQIREAYGRIVYTQTCHDKMVKRLKKYDEWVKIGQIVLSALTTGSFLMIILGEKESAYLGAVISTALLILNAMSKNFKFIETAKQHQIAADLLWKIREEYVSLLTDFGVLELEGIMNKRDELQSRTHEVYSTSPRTDVKSYTEAQKSLKTDEEQTFSEKEIDVMLPNSIRRCNREMI